jgi:hypothetical protein
VASSAGVYAFAERVHRRVAAGDVGSLEGDAGVIEEGSAGAEEPGGLPRIVPAGQPHASSMSAAAAMTGVAAAIANAVYDATGWRVRELLITLDKLL